MNLYKYNIIEDLENCSLGRLKPSYRSTIKLISLVKDTFYSNILMIKYSKMTQLKIKSELLTLEQQLRVLERARLLAKDHKWGLCRTIRYAMVLELNISRFDVPGLEEDIPLFTEENAIKHGRYCRRGEYWWETRPHDFESRLNFLDWMINEIKQEIENEKFKN